MVSLELHQIDTTNVAGVNTCAFSFPRFLKTNRLHGNVNINSRPSYFPTIYPEVDNPQTGAGEASHSLHELPRILLIFRGNMCEANTIRFNFIQKMTQCRRRRTLETINFAPCELGQPSYEDTLQVGDAPGTRGRFSAT